MGYQWDRDDVAAGYASARPAVHPRVVALALERLGPETVAVAVDLGCGGGASTRPLVPLARQCIAVDPSVAMLGQVATLAPGARRVAATAESLPLEDRSIDLVGAAGSLEFTDIGRASAEIARVLRPGGAVFSYDFSSGRRFADHPGLDSWFVGELLHRWPRPTRTGTAVVTPAPFVAAGFEAVDRRRFDVVVPLTRAGYVDYLLTESFLVDAVRARHDRETVRRWIESTVPWPDPGGGPAGIVFEGYLLTARRPSLRRRG